ncbi:MAG: hypothetical protein KDA61_07820 [Planctomycetales bacterium]|nr:hypothetical protein [Planctomycetales bacterium]
MKRYLVRRRLQNSLITLAIVAGLGAYVRHRRLALASTSFFTGWILLIGLIFLSLLNVRKRVAAPPVGSAAGWLQAHIYVGLAAAPVWLMHAPLRWPNGFLESCLAALFAATWVSGVVGLYWTRTLPRRISRVGEEIVYEQASQLRSQLRDRAQAAVLGVVRTSGDAALGEFYHQRLQGYFDQEPGWRARCLPAPTLRKKLLAELTEATRYLSDTERKTAEELFSLIRKRDAVDYHEALQWRLKTWLIVHLALVWPLLLTAATHAWLAHLFSGGAG